MHVKYLPRVAGMLTRCQRRRRGYRAAPRGHIGPQVIDLLRRHDYVGFHQSLSGARIRQGALILIIYLDGLFAIWHRSGQTFSVEQIAV